MQPEVASIYYLSTCWYSAFCLDTLKSGRFGVMAKMASRGRGGQQQLITLPFLANWKCKEDSCGKPPKDKKYFKSGQKNAKDNDFFCKEDLI